MTTRKDKMIGTAISFFLAGERCAVTLQFGSYQSHSVIAPCIVNYAFSIEIILKLLLLLSNPNERIPKTHDIYDLYDHLDVKYKDFFAKNFHLYYALKCSFEKQFEETRKYDVNKKKYISIFETWRYSYDLDSNVISVGFLQETFRVCFNALKYFFPDTWRNYTDQKGDFFPCSKWDEFKTGSIVLMSTP